MIKKQLDNKQLDNKQQGNSELLLSKEREIFKNNYNKKLKKNQMNYLTKLIMVTQYWSRIQVNNAGLETDSSELKDPLAFLDSIKNMKYQQKKHDINKKNLVDI